METIPLFTLFFIFLCFIKFFLLFAFLQSTIISSNSIKVLLSYCFPVLQLREVKAFNSTFSLQYNTLLFFVIINLFMRGIYHEIY